MKNQLYLLIISSIVFFTTCKKDKTSVIKMEAQLNGSYWKSSRIDGWDLKNNTYDISGSDYNSENLLRETLIFSNFIKKDARNYFVNADKSIPFTYYKDSLIATYYTSVDDGDAGCDAYTVVEKDTANNYIQITGQKNNYQEIWGVFSVTLLKTNTCVTSQSPDTLRFRNGTFYVIVKQ